jgi:DNA mismatch repair enzyme (predicted ATPase)
MKAYDNLLPNDYLPSYFIFLETEPGSVDVNIHPTKTEIKFEDENVIFNILTASVKESIGENAFAPAIDFDMEGAHEMPAARADYYVPSPPKISYDPLFNPFVEEGKMKPSQWNSRNEWDSQNASDAEKEFSMPSYNNETGLTYNSTLFNDSIINERPSITIKTNTLLQLLKQGF